jgi:hypothetical protein
MKNKYAAFFLGWLMPGLGHIYIGNRWKATVFFVAIMASAVAGLTMGRFHNVYYAHDHYQFYAEIGNGLFTIVGSAVMAALHAAPVETTAPASMLAGTLPIADLYLMLAGLLNFIIAANAFDAAAAGRRKQ